MGGVFISYRRDDAGGDAHSIRDRLARKFGESNLFMDVDSLLAGRQMISFFFNDCAQIATYAVPMRRGRSLLQPQTAR